MKKPHAPGTVGDTSGMYKAWASIGPKSSKHGAGVVSSW